MNAQVKTKPDDTKARIAEVAEALFMQIASTMAFLEG